MPSRRSAAGDGRRSEPSRSFCGRGIWIPTSPSITILRSASLLHAPLGLKRSSRALIDAKACPGGSSAPLAGDVGNKGRHAAQSGGRKRQIVQSGYLLREIGI